MGPGGHSALRLHRGTCVSRTGHTFALPEMVEQLAGLLEDHRHEPGAGVDRDRKKHTHGMYP